MVRMYWGWADEGDGKVHVSAMNATFEGRPSAVFDTREAAIEEIKRRECELTWEDGWRG